MHSYAILTKEGLIATAGVDMQKVQYMSATSYLSDADTNRYNMQVVSQVYSMQ